MLVSLVACLAIQAAVALPLAAQPAASEVRGAHGSFDVPHPWPRVRGHLGAYGTTSLRGPPDLPANFSWSWHHPGGRYHTTMLGGGLIDSERNIYVSTEDGIFKVSSLGETLWHYNARGTMSNVPVLHGNYIFGTSTSGWVFALTLEDGLEVWAERHAPNQGPDTAYVEAHAGVVVYGANSGPGGGNTNVHGVNATNGALLWEYDVPSTGMGPNVVWNVMAMFPDDDTTVFMDKCGGVHRVGLTNGTSIWYTPVDNGSSFSDGGLILGPDGDVFTCSNPPMTSGDEGSPGLLRRFRLADGAPLWEASLPHPCNSWPAVSPDGSTVVVVPGSFNGPPPTLDLLSSMHLTPGMPPPPGLQFNVQSFHDRMVELGEGQREGAGLPNLRASIMAFDAASGEELWRHDVRPWGQIASAGDEEGVIERLQLQIRPMCLPAHWSSPTIDADGTVYVGRTSGELYRYSPSTGESTFTTGTGPLHSGVTFGPGMMAYTDCDSLYVFNI